MDILSRYKTMLGLPVPANDSLVQLTREKGRLMHGGMPVNAMRLSVDDLVHDIGDSLIYEVHHHPRRPSKANAFSIHHEDLLFLSISSDKPEGDLYSIEFYRI